MRILRIFFSALIAISVVGVIAFFIGRELLLYTAVGQVRSAARELRSLGSDSGFTTTCLEYAGLPPNGISLTKIQLRFVSDKEYVLEVVCQGTDSISKVFRQDSLPMLVTKVPGQSGIIGGQVDHGVVLTIFGRSGVIYEDEDFILTSLQFGENPDLIIDQGPKTTCEGYGFQCCNEAYQAGVGNQIAEALDCPLSCYSQCDDRPVVLSFNSFPVEMSESRVVTINSGEEIEFFYVVNDIQGDAFARATIAADEADDLSWEEKLFRIISQLSQSREDKDSLEVVVLNFGDGKSQELTDLQDTVLHTYTCSRSLCVYNATVQAVTKEGLTSAPEGIGQIQIQVKR